MGAGPARGPRTAVVAGSAMEDLFEARGSLRVRIDSGEVEVFICGSGPTRLYFLPRHLKDHSVPPHRVDYRANLLALKELGVERVIATGAVGSISGKLEVGGIGLLDQFIDLSAHRITIFEDEPVHTDMTHPYDKGLQGAVVRAAHSMRLKVVSGLVYVSVDGPRYETAAEIQMFRMIGGDVVGMTGAPEAVVARELGLRYASIVVATNKAAGLQNRVSHEEVVAAMDSIGPLVKRLILRTVSLANRI